MRTSVCMSVCLYVRMCKGERKGLFLFLSEFSPTCWSLKWTWLQDLSFFFFLNYTCPTMRHQSVTFFLSIKAPHLLPSSRSTLLSLRTVPSRYPFGIDLLALSETGYLHSPYLTLLTPQSTPTSFFFQLSACHQLKSSSSDQDKDGNLSSVTVLL